MSIRGALFAATYDRQIAKAERDLLAGLRTDLLSTARGDVLEIGGGTGANIAAYPTHLSSLTITDPEPGMVKRLRRRAEASGREVTVLRAPAEDLPFSDDSFDTVVSTLVLCGVSDQQRVLRQIARVLRPGGQLLFVEHVRSELRVQPAHRQLDARGGVQHRAPRAAHHAPRTGFRRAGRRRLSPARPGARRMS
jgi:ubiquinone/menaquinone biosynthesis C-methylase UbiE